MPPLLLLFRRQECRRAYSCFGGRNAAAPTAVSAAGMPPLLLLFRRQECRRAYCCFGGRNAAAPTIAYCNDWTSGLLDFWTSGLPDFWTSGLLGRSG